jgi:predicted RNA-binding Zn ribbon-like protein
MTIDLPERLSLPLASGAPYWYWLGGRPALDLVNTLRERWRRRVECLAGPDDLAEWLRRAGVLVRPATASPRHVDGARELREAIDGAVRAVVAGEEVAGGHIGAIDAWLRRAAPRPALRAGPPAPRLAARGPDDPVDAALGLVALDAARMLGGPERERIRICAAPTCSARFFDRSPAARRRWCSMRECGNRAKARRHRARAGTSGERRTT